MLAGAHAAILDPIQSSLPTHCYTMLHYLLLNLCSISSLLSVHLQPPEIKNQQGEVNRRKKTWLLTNPNLLLYVLFHLGRKLRRECWMPCRTTSDCRCDDQAPTSPPSCFKREGNRGGRGLSDSARRRSFFGFPLRFSRIYDFHGEPPSLCRVLCPLFFCFSRPFTHESQERARDANLPSSSSRRCNSRR